MEKYPLYSIEDLYLKNKECTAGEVIIDEVVRLLRSNPKIKAKAIAKSMGVKPEHLSGAVSILTGKSLEEMTREWRMLHAMHLIRDTMLSFKVIAKSCGYAQAKTLAIAMQRRLHMSPYEYRYGFQRNDFWKFRRGLIHT